MDSNNQAVLKQPDPQPGKTNVGEIVIEDLQDRIESGIIKYGTPLQTFNGRDSLWDAYQEVLDLSLYIRQKLLEGEESEEEDTTFISPEQAFVLTFNRIAQMHHGRMATKGFWDYERNDGESLMLMVSELAEALEAIRHNNAMSDKITEFYGVEEELADLILRVMDMAMGRGWRVAEALIAKMEYNLSRPNKHGKKF